MEINIRCFKAFLESLLEIQRYLFWQERKQLIEICTVQAGLYPEHDLGESKLCLK